MSGIAERLAEVLAEHREDYAYPDSCTCEDAIPDARGGHFAAHVAQALLPVVEREIAAVREEAWLEGHAAGRDYQGDGWNSDVHDPAKDNPYRAALSPDPDRGEGEGK